jgi:hypothetical protein
MAKAAKTKGPTSKGTVKRAKPKRPKVETPEVARFEELVRWGQTMVLKHLDSLKPEAGPIRDFRIGYDQSRFFFQVTQDGEPDHDAIEKLFDTPQIRLPKMPASYREDYDDADEAASEWGGEWSDCQIRLSLLAAGLIALSLRDVEPPPAGVAPDCKLGVYEDYHTMRVELVPTHYDPFFLRNLSTRMRHPQTGFTEVPERRRLGCRSG